MNADSACRGRAWGACGFVGSMRGCRVLCLAWRLALGWVLLGAGVRPAAAQSDAGGLFKLWEEGDKGVEFNSAAILQNAGHTRGSNYSLGLSVYESQGRWRLINQYPINPTVGYDLFSLDIRSSHPRLPAKLMDASVGVASPLKQFGDHWFLAASLGVGYAGDVPFSQGNAWYGKGTVLVGKQLGPESTLIFALDYDGNRPILPDVPVPGVVYSRRLDPTLLLSVGFPFSSIEWKPTRQFTLNVRYEFSETIDAEARYDLTPQWQAFANFENRLRAFRAEGVGGNDRLIFQQRRAEVGVRWQPKKFVALSTAVGLAFSQKFDVGFDTRDTTRLATPSDEPYLRFNLEIRP